MANVISSNPQVISIFSEMEKIILNEDGFIHPDIRIVEDNGNLIVESGLDQNNKEIIFSVPESCLFDTKDVSISLSNNNLIATAYKENITDLHKKMCELMLNLFNQTHKIPFHKKTFPLELLNKADAFNLISIKCPGICAKHKRHSETLSHNQILVQTFLGCRQLNIKMANRSNAQVLMPFIDSLNHHVNGTPIDIAKISNTGLEGIQIKHCKPVASSNECFINYGPMDPMPRYLHFGFVDTDPHHLHSIPMEINLANLGKIIIRPFNHGMNHNQTLFSNKLNDIQQFIPNTIKQKDVVVIWRLLIPANNDFSAMRRVLEALIVDLAGKKFKKKQLEKHIKYAEEQIISSNNNYFKKLLALSNSEALHDLPEIVIKDFQQLAKLQIDILRKYQNKAEKLPLSYL